MTETLFIPTRCKVGFNPRNDTYSGKLAYVIAQDGKKWRKETSWLGWIYNYIPPEEYEVKKRADYENRKQQSINYFNRMQEQLKDHDSGKQKMGEWLYASIKKTVENGLEAHLIQTRIDPYENFIPSLGRTTADKNLIPYEFDNVPTEGFVLNKRVGGYSSGWNHRQTYARVYDPRGFEFEISMENLLFILQECNSVKGKALEGEFVYSWSGKDLILLPTSSSDYTGSKKFNEAQKSKVGVKDLVVGHEYMNKSMENVVYLGKLDFSNVSDYYGSTGNGHVFYNNKWKNFILGEAVSNISSKVGDSVVTNFADILTDFENKYQLKNFKHRFTPQKSNLPTKTYLGSRVKPRKYDVSIKLSESEVILAKVTLDLGEPRGRWTDVAVKEYHVKSTKKIVFENGTFKVSKYEKYDNKFKPEDIGKLDIVNIEISNNGSSFKVLNLK